MSSWALIDKTISRSLHRAPLNQVVCGYDVQGCVRYWDPRKARLRRLSGCRQPLSRGRTPMKRLAVIYDEKAQRMADAMIAAEAQHIAHRKAALEDCDCKDGMFPTAGITNRRKFLV